MKDTACVSVQGVADLEVMASGAASTGPESLGWGSEGSYAARRPHPTTCMEPATFAKDNTTIDSPWLTHH